MKNLCKHCGFPAAKGMIGIFKGFCLLCAVAYVPTIMKAGPVKVLTAPVRHPIKTAKALKQAGKATGKGAKATAKATKAVVW